MAFDKRQRVAQVQAPLTIYPRFRVPISDKHATKTSGLCFVGQQIREISANFPALNCLQKAKKVHRQASATTYIGIPICPKLVKIVAFFPQHFKIGVL